MKNYFVVGLYLIFTVSGLILMKIGGEQLTFKINVNKLSLEIGWLSLLGIFFYMISFILWISILPKYNLNFLVPFTVGIVQILSLLAATLIFKESLTGLKLIGIILVICGVVVMNF
jgi:drug/metabolite transporter (DMT)-like permease